MHTHIHAYIYTHTYTKSEMNEKRFCDLVPVCKHCISRHFGLISQHLYQQLILNGAKTIETRKWPVFGEIRGPFNPRPSKLDSPPNPHNPPLITFTLHPLRALVSLEVFRQNSLCPQISILRWSLVARLLLNQCMLRAPRCALRLPRMGGRRRCEVRPTHFVVKNTHP